MVQQYNSNNQMSDASFQRGKQSASNNPNVSHILK